MATVTRRLAALLGASGAGLTDSATASKITTDSINDDAVNAAKIAANAVGTSEVADNVLTATDLAANSVGESELSVDYTAQSVPHIIPGVLQPAIAGKLLNGATHSGAYGTPQTQSGGDGHSYYYTDIKGSKPIKDPRIGAHFGSQRHKFKSLQILEQETATHGENVYSVDGREWIRCVGGAAVSNGSAGHRIDIDQTTSFIEIIGFFSDINYIPYVTGGRGVRFTLDGGLEDTTDRGQASVSTPLLSRYVDSGSVENLPISTSLGIHTVKLRASQTHSARLFGVELITQDTSNRNNIQIPSQDVVSYGKKFNVSGTPHYDPFTTMSYGGSGTTLSALQSLIDTDTSLGMDAWKAGTSNYHRPWNGGRVIKWVDSSGTIKTSVNMMPPNAQNIGTTASNAVSDAHVIAGTNDDTINFNTSAIDHSQAEVAKTFHFREFGNGSANGTITGSYPDASMLDTGTNRDIAYVMDDGLTGLSADDVRTDSTRGTIRTDGINDTYHITFIGTGFTFTNQNGGTTFGNGDDFDFIVDGVVVKSWQSGNTINEKTTVVQNLPYGTHVFQMLNAAAPAAEHMHAKEFTFHQPKKPPIPEDACVIADYMLMADFVGLGAGNTTDKRVNISKGVRRLSSSRDVFYDNSSFGLFLGPGYPSGFSVGAGSNDYSAQVKISFFGDKVVYLFADPVSRLPDNDCTFSSGTKGTTVDVSNNNDHVIGARQFSITDGPRATTFTADSSNASNSYGTKNGVDALDLATPIHTSSHYQSFETPFLHELVGGDRNMEQTNLVCSPDGKTWDQLTRDTSYMGKTVVFASRDGGNITADGVHIWDYWRGNSNTKNYFNKQFAIGYDRLICLEEGFYEIHTEIKGWENHHMRGYIRINGVNENWMELSAESSQHGVLQGTLTIFFKRGDYVDVYRDVGDWLGTTLNENHLTIKRV